MEKIISLFAVFAPLVGGLTVGIGGSRIGKAGAHFVTIFGMVLSFLASLYLCKLFMLDQTSSLHISLYHWINSGGFSFNVGFLLDRMSVLMMAVVTCISLLVHIYSIGYMADDPGYSRFFSYMSLFTFAMLMLVSADNFLQLFFGWEGVGVISYLLIGFWFNKESAAAGSLKAFLVNRVGDFGFILAIALIFGYTGSVEYEAVFSKASALALLPVYANSSITAVTLICLLLFVGAMGKSAQMPLHVWLPESMEGPTPISALIHAATMVTAGIYMIARMSPLFELSESALSTVMLVGATGAFLLGLVAIVQFDMKRIIAYSTMSQLGYMVAATGSSAFAAGMFHLLTHAFFKALLFLAAGSVIVALHHEQDIRKMGNLKKYLPVTYFVFLIGSLSLSAVPPFSGFYSKDAIIEAVKHSTLWGASYAYVCLVMGAFITALYSFRALFIAFHGKERLEDAAHVQEPSWLITLPIVLLAIPSVIMGAMMVEGMLYQAPSLLGDSIYVAASHHPSGVDAFEGWLTAMFISVETLPFWFVMAGILTAWLCYVRYPYFPKAVSQKFDFLYRILIHQYGFDYFYDWFFVRGSRRLSAILHTFGDAKLIDGLFVNGSAHAILFFAKCARIVQSGYLYDYVFVMIIGLVALLSTVLINF